MPRNLRSTTVDGLVVVSVDVNLDVHIHRPDADWPWDAVQQHPAMDWYQNIYHMLNMAQRMGYDLSGCQPELIAQELLEHFGPEIFLEKDLPAGHEYLDLYNACRDWKHMARRVE